ncbi:unnamed protein product [Miscanthus lutarioriparius]|uniref:Potassium transporter n=1 Tax=Miscanthus lutarioriparius TaxID=422564 RepID=A0A811PQC5_9POAL|nr:unnamed protein product [Miscanthus lutarioriparius]
MREPWWTLLLLAYQSLGVVYGDLSISPLYVYKSTFAEDITHSEGNEEIYGALSFVFWTLTLIPLLKYVTTVLRADDNGEGGTFALYSLICRHANVSLLPNRQVADEELSTYRLERPPEAAGRSGIKAWLEKHKNLHTALLVMVMIGTCMVIGDGVLTPAISESVRWPILVLAILASVVGSQAIISGTFSIISHSQSLSCFPRVKVVHTSDKVHGQIYIPEVNWILMVLCIAVTVGFRLAVITVMLVTTCLMSLVIMLCWDWSPWLALAFFLFFGSIEALYFSASLIKFLEGAWLPILLAHILLAVMFVWHHTTIKKYEYDMHNKVTLEWLLALGDKLSMVRVPGIGLVYTDLTSGVPANFSRFVTNLLAFHRVLVFICVKSVTVPHVLPAERYLVGRVGPPGHRSYRCIVRYGYRDVHQDVDSFETELVESLGTFIKLDALFRFSDAGGGEQWDSSYYERENELTLIGSNPLRRHMSLGYDESHSHIHRRG